MQKSHKTKNTNYEWKTSEKNMSIQFMCKSEVIAHIALLLAEK